MPDGARSQVSFTLKFPVSQLLDQNLGFMWQENKEDTRMYCPINEISRQNIDIFDCSDGNRNIVRA